MDSNSLLVLLVLGFTVVYIGTKALQHRRSRKNLMNTHLEEVARTLREVTSRDPSIGPSAKPWKQRRTTKPFPEYTPSYWRRWPLTAPLRANEVILPEEAVGSVFPDDRLLVDGYWRQVLEVKKDRDQPYAVVSKVRESVSEEITERH